MPSATHSREPSSWSPGPPAASARPARVTWPPTARPCVAARRADRLEQLAGDIESDGGKALAIEADVTDRAQAQAAVQRTVDELGRLDTVVNNAGVMLLGPVEGAPVDEWDADGGPERQGPAVRGRRRPAPPARRRRGRAAAGGRPGQHQLGGRPLGQQGQRGLQRDQARRRRVQRGAAPGGHPAPRACVADGAGRGAHRAGQPEPRRRPRGRREDVQQHGEPRGVGHRRRDHLHRHPATPGGGQRAADPPDRAGCGISASSARRNASTTSASNCLPAHLHSSSRAASWPIALR